jgi:hypothetical protein
MKKLLKISLTILCVNTFCYAQTFTRVTDTLNPITTDAFESGGGSWIDFNNDGLLDLMVSNGNLTNQNNSLYLNKGNGNFIRVTSGNIVTDGGSSIGSTCADYNSDGFIDCFVTNRNNFGNFLYNGLGDTVFTKITTGSPVTDIGNSNSSSWVDIDNDGDLDLYVVNFQGADFMYLNSGAPSYSLSTTTNTITAGTNLSIPGAWADYNNDLRPDLFIANSGTQNDFLFTNNGGLAFTQFTFSDGKAGLGASWGDYDNDGDLDLFSANYSSSGNILYNNSGAPSYSLTPVITSVVAESANSVGSAWGDVDNDGDLDLFVDNDGAVNFFYLNNGAPTYTFTKVTTGSVVSYRGNSFGCVFADYDNDGQLDLFVANRLNEQNFLYHNNGNTNNWITVKCNGVASNKSGVGAKVYVKATIGGTPIWQMQEVAAQTGYNSQNLWLHFGLGNAALIDTLIVKWSLGTIDTCYNISANKFYTATEGACLTAGINEYYLANNNLIEIYPNPTTGSFAIYTKGNAQCTVYDINGKVVLSQKLNSKTNIDASNLPNGVYNVSIINNSGIANKRLVIVK